MHGLRRSCFQTAATGMAPALTEREEAAGLPERAHEREQQPKLEGLAVVVERVSRATVALLWVRQPVRRSVTEESSWLRRRPPLPAALGDLQLNTP